MGRKKRKHPTLEQLTSRPWCYYCERDFEDLKLLINHQKAKHYKCNRCGRRLNTAGGLAVHLNQVHKETLDKVENALPGRTAVDIEIFGMEGVPDEVLENHDSRIITSFLEAQDEHRHRTGNPLPGQPQLNKRPTVVIEPAEQIVARFRRWRAEQDAKEAAAGGVEAAGEAMEGVVQYSAHPQDGALAAKADPAYSNDGFGSTQTLPQRPSDGRPQGDDIDNMIRMAEAGIKPPPPHDAVLTPAAPGKPNKKEKIKSSKMIYDDVEYSPEERMAALPRYALTSA